MSEGKERVRKEKERRCANCKSVKRQKTSDGAASAPPAPDPVSPKLASFRDLPPVLTNIINSKLTKEEHLRLSTIDRLSYIQNAIQAESSRITKFMAQLQGVPQRIANNFSGREPSRLELPLLSRVASATGYANGVHGLA